MRVFTQRVCAVLLVVSFAQAAHAQRPLENDLSLEDLLQIEVTSVSKKEEPLFQAPSAIFVIGRADIRRSGATSVPDLLRLVPGVSVAQISSSEWAVAARGFNSLRANKLLVMIDGRSVYSILSSGVDWDVMALPVEEIERIEVIRGPGASIWGANAVNGVINIVTRDSFDTRGGYAQVQGGSIERGSGFCRFGGQMGSTSSYRIHGKYVSRDASLVPGTRRSAGDDWHRFQGGFRTDLRLSRYHALMISGSVTEATIQANSLIVDGVNSTHNSTQPTDAHSRSLNLDWTHTTPSRSSMTLSASYHESRRSIARFAEDFDVVTIEFQHRSRPLPSHDFVWGLGQRIWEDRAFNTYMVSFTPDHDWGSLTHAFVHDEIALSRRLNLTLGAKFEKHDGDGVHVQPNVRVAVPLSHTRTAWAAVSRAIREPSRPELGLRANVATFQTETGLPVLVSVLGNPEFRPEHLTSYEAGYRVQLTSGVQIDTAAFYGRYRNLRFDKATTFVETEPAPAHLVLGSKVENHLTAASYGLETLVRWRLMPWWQVEGAYSWFKASFGGNSDPMLMHNGSVPSHQWRAGTGLDLPRSFRLDVNAYGVGALDTLGVARYTRLDARVNREFGPAFSLGVVGQNLLDPSHVEFSNSEGRRGPAQFSRQSDMAILRRLFLSCALALGFALPLPAGPLSEFEVKAAFLVNFARFIEWPTSAYTSGSSPFVIAVMGDDPFGGDLDDAVAGKAIGGHPITTRRITWRDDSRAAHIIFISDSEKRRVTEVLRGLEGAPAVTVSDIERFCNEGGAITFIDDADRVRFEINVEAANRHGVRISSKLPSLAQIHKDGE